MPAPTIAELLVADEPERWAELGFQLEGDGFGVGSVRVRFVEREGGRGLLGWTLRDAVTTAIDGLATETSIAPARSAGAHPNGVLGIDHVVVLTPDLERTTSALEAAGIALRRVRDAGTPEQPLRQGFFRMGDVILELVQTPRASGSATFWGIVFLVADIDACAELLDERLGEVHDAVQRGRRIASVSPAAGVGTAVAFMTTGGGSVGT